MTNSERVGQVVQTIDSQLYDGGFEEETSNLLLSLRFLLVNEITRLEEQDETRE